ncbi:hypothetical protein C5L14_00705 [Labrys okinawensis]|uniref:Uncharacterized protein n=1 Tax=Labrys okinawensis TaxID=346911 RepID=A0A2S9QIH1_9HYPH|nr:hypothetical protein C5L14_00705 [Labrys okinawensis]
MSGDAVFGRRLSPPSALAPFSDLSSLFDRSRGFDWQGSAELFALGSWSDVCDTAGLYSAIQHSDAANNNPVLKAVRKAVQATKSDHAAISERRIVGSASIGIQLDGPFHTARQLTTADGNTARSLGGCIITMHPSIAARRA